MKAMRYIGPPDYLLRQLSVYTEEKFEDEEDLRERSLSLAHKLRLPQHTREISESQEVFSALITLAKQHASIYPIILETLRRCTHILEQHDNKYDAFIMIYISPIDAENLSATTDFFHVFDKLVETAATTDNL